jgi:hypothetical protein
VAKALSTDKNTLALNSQAKSREQQVYTKKMRALKYNKELITDQMTDLNSKVTFV